MFGEEPVGRLPVVELVVVRRRVPVLVPRERVSRAIKFEEGPDAVVDVRLHQRGSETAGIFRVVNQQGGPRGPQGREVCVVLAVRQVGRVFLDLIRVNGTRDVGLKRAKSGYLGGDCDPLVESSQDDSLPAAAR